MNNQDKLKSNNERLHNPQKLNNFIDMDSLLINLKNEDARTLRKMKNFKLIFFIMIIIYTLLMVVNPDPELQLHHRLSGLFYVISFTFFAFLFRKYHKEYSKIDYSLSSSEMFRKAAERHNLTFSRYLVVLPSLLFIDIGLTISEYYRWSSIEPLNRILIVQVTLIPIFILSGFIGYLIWRKKQKPLRDGALQILKELNGL